MHNGQPMRWADVRQQQYIDRQEYDRQAQALHQRAQGLEQGRKWLFDYARQLESMQRGGQQQPQQPTREQLLNNVRGMAAVDGQSVAELVEALHSEGLSPIARQVAGMAQQNQQLQGRLQQLEQLVAPVEQQHRDQQFDQHVDRHLSTFQQLEIPGLPWRINLNDPASAGLRELAKDLWLSHNQQEWTDRDFQKQLLDRISSMANFVRAGDRAYQNHLKTQGRQRFFPTRDGAGNPSGPQPFVFQSGHQMAKELASQGFFDRSQGT